MTQMTQEPDWVGKRVYLRHWQIQRILQSLIIYIYIYIYIQRTRQVGFFHESELTINGLTFVYYVIAPPYKTKSYQRARQVDPTKALTR